MTTIETILTGSPNATDAEILAALEASRNWRRVPVGEVKLWLLTNNLLGTLYYIRDTSDNPQLKGGLSEFLAGLTLYESIDATDAAIRTKATTLTGALAHAAVITNGQLTSFIDLLKEPNTQTQTDINRYRRRILVQSHIDAAAQATDAAQAYIAAATEWANTGAGEMPTFS